MRQLIKLLLLSLLLWVLPSCAIAQKSERTTPKPSPPSQLASSATVDDPIGDAFANGTSNIQVEGQGTVIKLLPDDQDGSRHQRFIVKLASGQTLLITHNIDIAPRISGLEVGDTVRFNGEYIWNTKGGLIHWTHHDPRGKHVTGWVIHNGKTYK